jgi:hypothetical protein
MEDQNSKATALLDRYLKGECTPEERQIVETVYRQYAQGKSIKENELDFTQIGEDSFIKISAAIDAQEQRPIRLWPRIHVL